MIRYKERKATLEEAASIYNFKEKYWDSRFVYFGFVIGLLWVLSLGKS